MTQDEIEQKLCEEIGVIAKREPTRIDRDASLRSNGLNSMTFIELLLSVERIWNIKLYEKNLPASETRSVRALAARIVSELSHS